MSDPGDGVADTLELPAGERRATAELPHSIGNFQILARLGEGGMGVVYAGRDVDLDRPAAIKLLKAGLDHPEYHARLLREAQAMARFEHPNVVKVYGVGTDRGRMFVAMELVEGTTLAVWLQTPRTWSEIIAMFAQAGAGLAAVHRAGLVHRDFKPQNVLVDRDGRAHVADFGLARFDDSGLTRTGAVMGTPGYMAPEQQLGRAVDARADQYSFCVALHAALVDANAWSTTPPAIRAAIMRGLAHVPGERFASMDELLDGLRTPVERRSRRAIVLGAIGVAGLAVVGAVEMRRTPEPVVAVPAAAPHVVIDATPDARELVVVVPDAPRAPVDASITPKLDARLAPVAHEMTATDLPAVRAAIDGLGYRGLTFTGDDLSGDIADLRTKVAAVAADDPTKRALLLDALGAAERRNGDCDAAMRDFKAASTALDAAIRPNSTNSGVWNLGGRIRFGIGLCLLGAGQAVAALPVLRAAVPTNDTAFRAEVHFAAGVATIVTGGARDVADADLVRAQTDGDDKVRRALAAWAQAHPR